MQCRHPKRYKKILCARCVHFICNDCMISYDGHAFCSHACIRSYSGGLEPPAHTVQAADAYSIDSPGNGSTFTSRIFKLIDYTSEHPTAISTNILRGSIGVAASAFMAFYLFTSGGEVVDSPLASSTPAKSMHASLTKDITPHDVEVSYEALPPRTRTELLSEPLFPDREKVAVTEDSEPLFEKSGDSVETAGVELPGRQEEAPVESAVDTPPAVTRADEPKAEEEAVLTASVAGEEIVHETTVFPDYMDRSSLEDDGITKEMTPLFLPGEEIELFDLDSGITSEMKVSVTFDGGSKDNHADEILDALAERGIKTTFFLAGQFIKRFPDTVKRILEEGHEIANHTRNHPHLTSYETNFRQNTLPGVTREFLLKELREADMIYTAITGKKMSPYWRAPYGEVNVELIEWAADEGYIHVGWTTDHDRKKSLDTLDWVSDKDSDLYLAPEEITERVLSYDDSGDGLRGGIILMHLGSHRTTDSFSSVLGDLIDSVTAKGYELVKVSELFERKRSALRQKAAEEETVALKNASAEDNLGL